MRRGDRRKVQMLPGETSKKTGKKVLVLKGKHKVKTSN